MVCNRNPARDSQTGSNDPGLRSNVARYVLPHRKLQNMNEHVTLFLCGDVMTGRGIDQIQPFPGDPRLYEPCMDTRHGLCGACRADSRTDSSPRRIRFRGDLGLMFLADMNPTTGKLLALRMIPTQLRRFRVNRASEADSQWLEDLLNREGKRFGTHVKRSAENIFTLKWS